MNTIDFFNELFRYNYESNKSLITYIRQNGDRVPANVLRLLSHISNAHHIWNNRILQTPIRFKVWQEHNLEEIETIHNDNHAHTLNILRPDRNVNLETDKTREGKLVRDVLFHVINHSTYHRAQIAAELRRADIEPLSSDYILFRKRRDSARRNVGFAGPDAIVINDRAGGE